jgi:protoporphyrinogen oxidase
MTEKTAIIIGGGPAGLTAALELLRRTRVKPVVLEADRILGGISRTEVVEGNRIDIGGHRFFSKSDEVMRWWLDILPLERGYEQSIELAYQGKRRSLEANRQGPDPAHTDDVMLVRPRSSRIYWNRKLLDYPLKLSPDTVRKIGVGTLGVAGLSYAHAMAFPISKEHSLEDFLINRFGRKLYSMFFQSYTEKVWGVPCRDISAEWGAQRIKGLDIRKVIRHALTPKQARPNDVAQKKVETSLIEQFLYPKFGPGQMWETVARKVEALGGDVLLQHRVTGLRAAGNEIVAVEVEDARTGERHVLRADYVLSTMPVRELVRNLRKEVPEDVREVAEGLVYRDFFTVGLLVDRLRVAGSGGQPLLDNWCYVQAPEVLLGRVQIFNNWSPWMVADPSKVWLGLEYFCFERDELWSRPDSALVDLGAEELERIGMIDRRDVRLGRVIRMRKTYPAYFGTYSRFGVVRDYLDRHANLFCLGRNGQHRYNNQDHSMLTAMRAVDSIARGDVDKDPVWSVNVEQEYHEEK